MTDTNNLSDGATINLEAACAIVCLRCKQGGDGPKLIDGIWVHTFPAVAGREVCGANDLRNLPSTEATHDARLRRALKRCGHRLNRAHAALRQLGERLRNYRSGGGAPTGWWHVRWQEWTDWARAELEQAGITKPPQTRWGFDGQRERLSALLHELHGSGPSRPYCVYCDWRGPWDDPAKSIAVIREHTATCPEHPMRAVERERDTLRGALPIVRTVQAWADADRGRGSAEENALRDALNAASPELLELAFDETDFAGVRAGAGDSPLSAKAVRHTRPGAGANYGSDAPSEPPRPRACYHHNGVRLCGAVDGDWVGRRDWSEVDCPDCLERRALALDSTAQPEPGERPNYRIRTRTCCRTFDLPHHAHADTCPDYEPRDTEDKGTT